MTKMFLPIPRDGKLKPPWGYILPTDGGAVFIPDSEALNFLDQAFTYLDEGASFQNVANWVKIKSGKSISDATLRTKYLAAPDRDEGREKRAKLTSNFTEHNPAKKYKKRTEEEKTILKLGRAKSRVTRQEKKLIALKESKAEAEKAIAATVGIQASPREEIKESETVAAEPIAVVAPVNTTIIRPNPGPQTEFLAASEFEVLFGGAAGPGKSWALVVDPLRTVHHPSHTAITFRKTNDELRELINMSKSIYPKVVPGAKFQEQKSTWIFPNGGTHWYRYLDRDADVEALQGQSFSWGGFDELTHWATPYVYEYIRSRIRSTDPELDKLACIRATSNPGSIGHSWVKRTFVDPAPPNTAFPAINIESGEVMQWHEDRPDIDKKKGDPLFYRRFIPGRLSDNPYLFKSGRYEANLLSLTDVKKRQLLDGDWDVAEGAAFSEFRRLIHTCDPFIIPPEWRRFRAADWGYDKPHCVLWFAMSPGGKLYVYREQYARKVLSPDLADKVLTAEFGERIQYGVLDSSAFHVRDVGPSPAQNMISRGCLWRPADRSPGSRLASKQEVHRRLQVRDVTNEITGAITQEPGLVIFNTCVNLVRTLPAIPLDKSNTEDVDTDSEDHAYDALRYGLVSKPLSRNERYVINAISMAPKVRYDACGFPIR